MTHQASLRLTRLDFWISQYCLDTEKVETSGYMKEKKNHIEENPGCCGFEIDYITVDLAPKVEHRPTRIVSPFSKTCLRVLG